MEAFKSYECSADLQKDFLCSKIFKVINRTTHTLCITLRIRLKGLYQEPQNPDYRKRKFRFL